MKRSYRPRPFPAPPRMLNADRVIRPRSFHGFQAVPYLRARSLTLTQVTLPDGTFANALMISSAGSSFTSDLTKWVDSTGATVTEVANDGHIVTTQRILIGSSLTIHQDGYIQATEIAAPSTPTANNLRLYAKDRSGVTGLFYIDDAGVEHDLFTAANVVKNTFKATATWDPASLLAGVTASTTITVTGAAVGDIAYATHDQIGANDVLISAHVQSANTVRVVVDNLTGGVLDIASGTLSVLVFDIT